MFWVCPKVGGVQVLDSDVVDLHAVWESTSFGLERLQCNPLCVDEEDLQVLKSCPFSSHSEP